MGAKGKIEGLTNSWYGFAVFSAIWAIVSNGIGIFSIGSAIFGLLVSWVLTFFLGRALVKKSSLTRALLLFISGILSLLGLLAVGRMTWTFVQTWQLSLLWTVAYSVAHVWMNVKSFRTLTDSSVKAYFN